MTGTDIVKSANILELGLAAIALNRVSSQA